MGASIYWKPNGGGTCLDVGLRSAFVKAMTDLYGAYPWTLNQGSIGKLEGLRSAWDGQDSQAITTLIQAIYDHESIDVWPEY